MSAITATDNTSQINANVVSDKSLPCIKKDKQQKEKEHQSHENEENLETAKILSDFPKKKDAVLNEENKYESQKAKESKSLLLKNDNSELSSATKTEADIEEDLRSVNDFII